MPESAARDLARRTYLGLLAIRARELGPGDLDGASVVFAPHPDDETLGCGGTIVRMIEGGGSVEVVFMTDGRRSHRGLMDEEELARLRQEEGLEACRRLGIPRRNVHFLGIHNGRLAEGREAALASVGGILRSAAPERVFVPYGRDPPVGSTDHRETYSIVLKALAGLPEPPAVLEYPIWYWQIWPMVGVPNPGIRRTSRFAAKSLLRATRLLVDFNRLSRIADVEMRKRDALEAHRTQVSRYMPDSPWQTLSDVSSGDFLECFFAGFELFRHHPGEKPS